MTSWDVGRRGQGCISNDVMHVLDLSLESESTAVE